MSPYQNCERGIEAVRHTAGLAPVRRIPFRRNALRAHGIRRFFKAVAASVQRGKGMMRSFLARYAPFALVAVIGLHTACGGNGGTVTSPSPSPSPAPAPAPAPAPSPSPSPSPAPPPSGAACAITLAGLPSALPEASGRYAFAVSTGATCAWTARTDIAWADIAPGSGQGDAPLTLVVAQNETRSTRTVTVTVNSETR